MREYGRVPSTFWTNPAVRSFSDDDKLLAVYLLSCAHGTMAGVCYLPDGYTSVDLKWPVERVAKGFGELSRKGFATRCATTDWVWVINSLDGVAYNPNQWKAARKIAASVPAKCSWRAAFQQRFGEAAGDFPKGSQTVHEVLPSVPVPVPASLTGGETVCVSGSDAREPPQTTQPAADIAAAPELPPKQPAPVPVAEVIKGLRKKVASMNGKVPPAPKDWTTKPRSEWTKEDWDEMARQKGVVDRRGSNAH
jgi:hypothetical protein